MINEVHMYPTLTVMQSQKVNFQSLQNVGKYLNVSSQNEETNLFFFFLWLFSEFVFFPEAACGSLVMA